MSQLLEALLAAAAAGERRALARLISLVEDEDPAAAAVSDWALARSGGAYRIGVTGPPGAGKSSLLDGLLRAYRARGLRLAALAVDPSSAFTGGALLGDRIRMHEAARDPEIFIRSLGSRGSLGGLARQTEAVADLLDAAGAERILIETLGVGQSELDIVENCFSTVVVLTPESGDGIQMMKAGLLEIGDLFVINKADREGAAALAMELEASLMRRGALDGWRPPVLQCVATEDRGVAELVEAIEQHRDFLTREGRLDLRRREQLARRLRAAVEARLSAALWTAERERALEQAVALVMEGRIGFAAQVAALTPTALAPVGAPPAGQS
jgi:LAO/AO transport system kinase